jgi:hypothetical protein
MSEVGETAERFYKAGPTTSSSTPKSKTALEVIIARITQEFQPIIEGK